jgi:hypothetical protein
MVRKTCAMAVLCVALTGCGAFGQGFRDESLKQLGEGVAGAVADTLDERLGSRLDGIGEVMRELPGRLPAPAPRDPAGEGALYGLGALLAYIVGSVGKGYLRAKLAKRDEESE